MDETFIINRGVLIGAIEILERYVAVVFTTEITEFLPVAGGFECIIVLLRCCFSFLRDAIQGS